MKSLPFRVSAFLLPLTFSFTLTASTATKKGTVALKLRDCDYFAVEYGVSYAILEHYSGLEPDRGDQIVGDFESYGLAEFYNVTKDDEFNAYLEDYMLTRGRALEELAEKCED